MLKYVHYQLIENVPKMTSIVLLIDISRSPAVDGTILNDRGP